MDEPTPNVVTVFLSAQGTLVCRELNDYPIAEVSDNLLWSGPLEFEVDAE